MVNLNNEQVAGNLKQMETQMNFQRIRAAGITDEFLCSSCTAVFYYTHVNADVVSNDVPTYCPVCGIKYNMPPELFWQMAVETLCELLNAETQCKNAKTSLPPAALEELRRLEDLFSMAGRKP